MHNGLALNLGKSEVIMIGTSQAVAMANIKSVTVAGTIIAVSDKVKSLGIILDKCLAYVDQVNSICTTIHYHISHQYTFCSRYLIALQRLDNLNRDCHEPHCLKTRLL